MKKRIKIQGTIIFLAVITLVILHKYLFLSPREKAWMDFFDIAGTTLVLLGYLLRIVSRGYKAEMNPDGRTLVTDGPYRLMRNPMYFGTLLIGLGTTLVLFKWWVGLVFLIVYLSIYLPQINREEATLSAYFGDKFKDYCKVSPKYFPSLYAISRIWHLKYFILQPSWIRKELASFLATFIFIVAVQVWKGWQFFGQVRYGKLIFEVFLVALVFLVIFRLGYEKKNISGTS